MQWWTSYRKVAIMGINQLTILPKIGLRRASIYSTFHAQRRDVALDRFKVESSKAYTWAIARYPQPMLRSYWCSTDLPSLMQWGKCCLRVAIPPPGDQASLKTFTLTAHKVNSSIEVKSYSLTNWLLVYSSTHGDEDWHKVGLKVGAQVHARGLR